MVGDAALREIIGADALVALTRAHLRATVLGVFALGLRTVKIIQAGFEHAHGFFFILQLAFFILTGDHQPGGHVRDAHGGVCTVDVLTAVTGRAVGIDADILLTDFHFHVLGLGQHGHGGGGGVDAAAGFGDGHALDAVYAGFKLEAREGAAARQRDHGFLYAAKLGIADIGDGSAHPAALGVAQIHAQKERGKQTGFLAACARAYFQNDVAVVVGIFGNKKKLEFFALQFF